MNHEPGCIQTCFQLVCLHAYSICDKVYMKMMVHLNVNVDQSVYWKWRTATFVAKSFAFSVCAYVKCFYS